MVKNIPLIPLIVVFILIVLVLTVSVISVLEIRSQQDLYKKGDIYFENSKMSCYENGYPFGLNIIKCFDRVSDKELCTFKYSSEDSGHGC